MKAKIYVPLMERNKAKLCCTRSIVYFSGSRNGAGLPQEMEKGLQAPLQLPSYRAFLPIGMSRALVVALGSAIYLFKNKLLIV